MKLITTIAQQWKNWELQRKAIRIQLYEELLRVERTEYAALNKLHGKALNLRFGCESEEDLAPFRDEQATWKRQLEDIAVEGLLNGKAEQFFGERARSVAA